MTALPELAITGSTGHLGGLLARQLADAGMPMRLLVRDVNRAPALPGALPVPVDYADAGIAAAALAGVKVLFMVSASEAEDRLQQQYAFIDAAAAAGVDHIVYTSFFGAAPEATFTLARDHWATEEYIRVSGRLRRSSPRKPAATSPSTTKPRRRRMPPAPATVRRRGRWMRGSVRIRRLLPEICPVRRRRCWT